MIWRNSLPWTEEGKAWKEDEFPPDQWYRHEPRPNAGVEKVSVPLAEDLEERAKQLCFWIITESLLDQLFRAPQISEEEYFYVHEYTKQLTSEVGFLLKPPLSPYDWACPYSQAWWCWQGDYWSRYPQVFWQAWEDCGWKLQPSFPHNDPRHIGYATYSDLRLEYARVQALKPIKIQRTPTFKKSGDPLLDELDDL